MKVIKNGYIFRIYTMYMYIEIYINTIKYVEYEERCGVVVVFCSCLYCICIAFINLSIILFMSQCIYISVINLSIIFPKSQWHIHIHIFSLWTVYHIVCFSSGTYIYFYHPVYHILYLSEYISPLSTCLSYCPCLSGTYISPLWTIYHIVCLSGTFSCYRTFEPQKYFCWFLKVIFEWSLRESSHPWSQIRSRLEIWPVLASFKCLVISGNHALNSLRCANTRHLSVGSECLLILQDIKLLKKHKKNFYAPSYALCLYSPLNCLFVQNVY